MSPARGTLRPSALPTWPAPTVSRMGARGPPAPAVTGITPTMTIAPWSTTTTPRSTTTGRTTGPIRRHTRINAAPITWRTTAVTTEVTTEATRDVLTRIAMATATVDADAGML